jgi:hypothetical protein
VQSRNAESSDWENFGMRHADRHTFRDRAPLHQEWSKPEIAGIAISEAEVDEIVTSADPESTLRRFYLNRKSQVPDS